MKNKKITFILVFALIVCCFAGCASSNANDETSSDAGAQSPLNAEEPSDTGNAEEPTNTGKSDKGKIAFVGIDAVAAEVLDVTEESLADTNHAEE